MSGKEKVLDRVIKMMRSSQSEAQLGNTEAAEAFAAAVNRMLLEHELSMTDVEYARSADNDPVVEIMVDLAGHNIKRTRTRSAWQESLAAIVANAHMCRFLVQAGSNRIWFVGTKAHAEVAEYVFGTLVPVVAKLSLNAYDRFWVQCKAEDGHAGRAKGYREAWLAAFLQRIRERFEEARATVVAEGGSTALIRLNQSLVKANDYMAAKFNKPANKVAGLAGLSASNRDGARDGRAAADRIALNKGVGTSRPAGSLGGVK